MRKFLLILLVFFIFPPDLAAALYECDTPKDAVDANTIYEACVGGSGIGFFPHRHHHNQCTADYGDFCLSLGHTFLTVTRDNGFVYGACVPEFCTDDGSCQVSADISAPVNKCHTRGGCKETSSDILTNCSGRMKVMVDLVGTLLKTDETGVCEAADNGEKTCDLDDAPFWWYTGIHWNW